MTHAERRERAQHRAVMIVAVIAAIAGLMLEPMSRPPEPTDICGPDDYSDYCVGCIDDCMEINTVTNTQED